jgi:hypothetical protein
MVVLAVVVLHPQVALMLAVLALQTKATLVVQDRTMLVVVAVVLALSVVMEIMEQLLVALVAQV